MKRRESCPSARTRRGRGRSSPARSRRRVSIKASSSASAAARPRRAPDQARKATGRGGEFVSQRHSGRERQPCLSRRRKPVADAGEVARASAPKVETGERPRQIRRHAEGWRAGIPAGRRDRRARRRPRGGAAIAATSVSGPASRSAKSRAPPGVTVRSMAASRLPARSPERVRVSSRLARVAASMASVAPAVPRGRRR